MLDIPIRYKLIVLLFFGEFNVSLLRVNLGIAIISMVNSTAATAETEKLNSSNDVCPGRNFTTDSNADAAGPFQWDSVQQGLVLGCYFYAFIVSSMTGPCIARKFGFKIVVGVAVSIASILTIFLPLVACQGIGAFVAVRILIGAFQGAVIPCMLMSFPRWIPPQERTFAFTFVSSGFMLGIFATLSLSSLISKYFSWEWVFYLSGAFALVWSVLWFWLVYESPNRHPRLSEREKNYLEKHIPVNKTSSKKENAVVPWIKILTNRPFWAILLGKSSFDWTITITTILVPTYMTSILNMDIAEAGGSSGFPYLIGTFVIILSGKLLDILRTKCSLSLTVIRKVFALIAMVGPGICIMAMCYVGCNGAAVISLYLLAVLLMLFYYAGTAANIFDISPTYCGVLFGISTALSLTTGFLAPQISGYVLQQTNGLYGWQIIFWITAGFNFVAALFYLVFGSAKEQPWSKERIIKTKEDCEIAQLSPDDQNLKNVEE